MNPTPFWLPRVAPFAAYMLLILIQDLLAHVLDETLARHLTAVCYPLKILGAGGLLIYYWRHYDELRSPGRWAWNHLIAALGVGVLVFALWIHMDWPFAVMGRGDVYDPGLLPAAWYWAFIGARLFGASVVVPLFEELFWRSFILRYIVHPDVAKVPVAAFSWPSFVISALLFGIEHHLWLAGIVAGLLYNLLLYRTRHLWYCVISHAVTNALLGGYVILTREWMFW